MGDLVDALLVEPTMPEGPELGRQRTRCRLEHQGHVEMIGAEAHALLAQGRATFLLQPAHFLEHFRALKHAERFGNLEGDAARDAGQILGILELDHGAERAHDIGLEPGFQPGLYLLASRAGEMLVGNDADLRLEDLLRRFQLADGIAAPADSAVIRQHEQRIGSRGETLRPLLDFACERLLRSMAQRLGLGTVRTRIRHEGKSVELSHVLAFDDDIAGGRNLRIQHRVLSQAPHQNARPTIDETARQPVVQSVGQPVLYLTGDALPMLRITQPVITVCDEGPCPHLRDAVGEGVDIPLDLVQLLDLLGKPVIGNAPVRHHETVQGRHQISVARGRHFSIIGHLANFPEPLDGIAAGGEVTQLPVADHDIECGDVLADGRAGQPVLARHVGKRGLKTLEGTEVEIGIAPLQHAQRLEGMRLDGLGDFRLERVAAPGGAETAIVQMPPGAPRDLADFRRLQSAEAKAVEFARCGESDMIDIEIEPHADRIGGDQVIHLARLIQRHLGVARAGRERAEHHRRAATLAPDQLGNGIDLLRREGDDGRARGQARDLALAGEDELRQARAGGDVHTGNQLLDQRLHRAGPDQQRLLAPALVEQVIGEDMAAIEIGGELHLVDGDKGEIEIPRHRLRRADPVARLARFDLLLAGDERHRIGPDAIDHALVDFARQQTQRQADHPGGMGQHALYGEMGLARIGRPQNGGHPARADLRWKGSAFHQLDLERPLPQSG